MELGADGNGTRHLNGGHEGRSDYERVQHALEQHDLDQHALDQHDLDQHALDQHALDQQALDQAACIMRIYKLTIPTIFAVLVILGLLGNILVIYVILANRKLRTVTNLLLLNLAVADVSFLLVCGSFSTVHYAMTEWPLGDALCRVTQYLLYVTCYVTVYTLVAVSVVRYVTVVHGPRARFIHSQRNVVLLIMAIWVGFLLGKIPILVVHGVSYHADTNRTECIIEGRTEGQQLFASFFVFAYALPLAAIATLYLMLLCHLRRTRQEALHQSPGGEERQRHVTLIAVLVVAVFAVCWLPLQIHLLVGYYGQIPESVGVSVLLIVWHSLVFANSLLNPLIYNCFSAEFREGFRRVFNCCCKADVVRCDRDVVRCVTEM